MSYTFTTTEWFATQRFHFGETPFPEIMTAMLDFLEDHKASHIDRLVNSLFPLEFVETYFAKRVSYPPKEAFRRALMTLIKPARHKPKQWGMSMQPAEIEAAIIGHVRRTGGFTLDTDLSAAVGRPVTPHDISTAQRFIASLTEDEIRQLFAPQHPSGNKQPACGRPSTTLDNK